MKPFLRATIGLVLLSFTKWSNGDDGLPSEHVEFYEKRVRPLLARHCHECHGSKKQEAGLRLDTRAGFLKGSENGLVFLVENIDGSRLMRVLRQTGDEPRMPPQGRLSDEQIADVRKWLELGAPWPAENESTSESTRPHWAYQSVKRPEIPSEAVTNEREIGEIHSDRRSPIDAFIVNSLRQKNLTLSEPADRETLIRRVTFNLWGIPPTFEDVREFVDDQHRDAFERLIDRLLSSPLYGQRWGRHWLDVARYADTKGYVFLDYHRYPYSYTYRDYVVNAFNADTPYDQFVKEQLAADMIVGAERDKSVGHEVADGRLAAMGFLTVGRRFLKNEHEIIDDRIDVVTRGLMGLTVVCARCHDHKFDPIPTADYYSLYGVFSSSMEPDELPLIGLPKNPAAYQELLDQKALLDAEITNFGTQSLPMLSNEIRDVAGDALQQIARELPLWTDVPALFSGTTDRRPETIERWEKWLQKTASMPHRVIGPWHRLAKVDKVEDFPQEVTRLTESWSIEEQAAQVNPVVREAIGEQEPKTLLDLARLYGNVFRSVNQDWKDLQATMPGAQSLPDSAKEEIRQVLYGDGSPADISLREAGSVFSRDIRETIMKMKWKAHDLISTSPETPPRAMVIRDGSIHEPVIFVRGNPNRRGKSVPRQFPEVVSGANRKPFTMGSGRWELAEAIVDSRNPLTARVIVNRIWQHHFGTGFVPTSSDFGTRGIPPSHPRLLDWLAAEMGATDGVSPLVASPRHWSIKQIHRQILTSATYRQSSRENIVARGIDPENRLLWQMPRQRLDFESLRDSLLFVSGRLDTSIGGQPFLNVMDPMTTRRTIYAFVDRNDLPGVFRAFDFADTDSTAAERPHTTVPQQSLFAMNSPFFQQQAHYLAAECRAANASDQLKLLFQRVLSRNPTGTELRRFLDFLSATRTIEAGPLSPWETISQVLLMANEFVFVD